MAATWSVMAKTIEIRLRTHIIIQCPSNMDRNSASFFMILCKWFWTIFVVFAARCDVRHVCFNTQFLVACIHVAWGIRNGQEVTDTEYTAQVLGVQKICRFGHFCCQT